MGIIKRLKRFRNRAKFNALLKTFKMGKNPILDKSVPPNVTIPNLNQHRAWPIKSRSLGHSIHDTANKLIDKHGFDSDELLDDK